MRVCFYAAVKDRRLLDLVQFYKQDIDALEALGHEVTSATRPREIRGSFDLYWVWWQTTGLAALATAAIRRRPGILVTALSSRDPSPSGMGAKGRQAHIAERLSLRLARLTLATCEDTRQGVLPLARNAVLTAPLGVDTALYRPAETRDRRMVLTISHITEQNLARKRLLDIPRVAALVPELDFQIVGEELDGAPRLRAEIARLEVADRVRLLGRVGDEEKRELLSKAAVYLQPTDYEAFGLAIAEAMASGAKVVSNAVGNVPDLVGDAGVLLPAGAPAEDLAAALRGLIAERGDLQVSEDPRERIERLFSLDRRIGIVEDAVERVASPGA